MFWPIAVIVDVNAALKLAYRRNLSSDVRQFYFDGLNIAADVLVCFVFVGFLLLLLFLLLSVCFCIEKGFLKQF